MTTPKSDTICARRNNRIASESLTNKAFRVIMSKLDEVVDELFGTFQRQFPLAGRASPSKRLIDQKLDLFYAEAHLVRKKHHLWIFGWARVVLKFQQRLLQSGHPPDGVKPLLLGMIVYSYNAK